MKKKERGLYLQKDFEIDFIPAIGMDFEPKLWTSSMMKNDLLICNKNKLLQFRIVGLLWSEIMNSELSVEAEGKITSQAFDFIWENLTEIDLETDWGYTGFPINPNKYFNDLRKEQEGMGIKKTKKGGESGNKKK